MSGTRVLWAMRPEGARNVLGAVRMNPPIERRG